MTNREKYGEQILDIFARTGEIRIAFDKESNMICHCDDIMCRDCLFDEENGVCTVGRIKEWLNAEYKEPKITIPEDTPIDAKILVSDNGVKWSPRHFAGFTKYGSATAWTEGHTSWTTKTRIYWEYAKLPEEELNKRPND